MLLAIVCIYQMLILWVCNLIIENLQIKGTDQLTCRFVALTFFSSDFGLVHEVERRNSSRMEELLKTISRRCTDAACTYYIYVCCFPAVEFW